MYEKCIALLEERGVSLEEIADCVLYLQKSYLPDLSKETAISMIDNVLKKREVQHAILTGIALDKAAEENAISDKELQGLLMSDASLYGVDEVLAYGICNLYGSIALTNYGYVDRVKPGVIGELNNHDGKTCNTFLDDIVGAIAASAASRIAHSEKEGTL